MLSGVLKRMMPFSPCETRRAASVDVIARHVPACIGVFSSLSAFLRPSSSVSAEQKPSVPISLETLSSNSLMSRAKEVFNVSRLVIIIEVRESITHQGGSGGQSETRAPSVFRRIQAAYP